MRARPRVSAMRTSSFARCSNLRWIKVGWLQIALSWNMAAFIYRCPRTGRNVQGWFADDVSGDEDETYEAVTCLACAQMHLVNRSTGRVLGADGN